MANLPTAILMLVVLQVVCQLNGAAARPGKPGKTTPSDSDSDSGTGTTDSSADHADAASDSADAKALSTITDSMLLGYGTDDERDQSVEWIRRLWAYILKAEVRHVQVKITNDNPIPSAYLMNETQAHNITYTVTITEAIPAFDEDALLSQFHQFFPASTTSYALFLQPGQDPTTMNVSVIDQVRGDQPDVNGQALKSFMLYETISITYTTMGERNSILEVVRQTWKQALGSGAASVDLVVQQDLQNPDGSHTLTYAVTILAMTNEWDIQQLETKFREALTTINNPSIVLPDTDVMGSFTQPSGDQGVRLFVFYDVVTLTYATADQRDQAMEAIRKLWLQVLGTGSWNVQVNIYDELEDATVSSGPHDVSYALLFSSKNQSHGQFDLEFQKEFHAQVKDVQGDGFTVVADTEQGRSDDSDEDSSAATTQKSAKGKGSSQSQSQKGKATGVKLFPISGSLDSMKSDSGHQQDSSSNSDFFAQTSSKKGGKSGIKLFRITGTLDSLNGDSAEQQADSASTSTDDHQKSSSSEKSPTKTTENSGAGEDDNEGSSSDQDDSQSSDDQTTAKPMQSMTKKNSSSSSSQENSNSKIFFSKSNSKKQTTQSAGTSDDDSDQTENTSDDVSATTMASTKKTMMKKVSATFQAEDATTKKSKSGAKMTTTAASGDADSDASGSMVEENQHSSDVLEVLSSSTKAPKGNKKSTTMKTTTSGSSDDSASSDSNDSDTKSDQQDSSEISADSSSDVSSKRMRHHGHGGRKKEEVEIHGNLVIRYRTKEQRDDAIREIKKRWKHSDVLEDIDDVEISFDREVFPQWAQAGPENSVHQLAFRITGTTSHRHFDEVEVGHQLKRDLIKAHFPFLVSAQTGDNWDSRDVNFGSFNTFSSRNTAGSGGGQVNENDTMPALTQPINAYIIYDQFRITADSDAERRAYLDSLETAWQQAIGNDTELAEVAVYEDYILPGKNFKTHDVKYVVAIISSNAALDLKAIKAKVGPMKPKPTIKLVAPEPDASQAQPSRAVLLQKTITFTYSNESERDDFVNGIEQLWNEALGKSVQVVQVWLYEEGALEVSLDSAQDARQSTTSQLSYAVLIVSQSSTLDANALQAQFEQYLIGKMVAANKANLTIPPAA